MTFEDLKKREMIVMLQVLLEQYQDAGREIKRSNETSTK